MPAHIWEQARRFRVVIDEGAPQEGLDLQELHDEAGNGPTASHHPLLPYARISHRVYLQSIFAFRDGSPLTWEGEDEDLPVDSKPCS